MTVAYTADASGFYPQAPQLWSPTPFENRPTQNPSAVHPDGQRMLMAPLSASRVDHLALLLNVVDDLKHVGASK
jgi:hypothetical protein